MKKNGYTLIELLSTFIILSIIMVIGIQTYFVLEKNNDQSKYDYYIELIKNSVDLYFESQISGLETGSCLSIEYNTLVSENYLKEEDVTCSGSISLCKDGRKTTYNLDGLSCKID